MKYTVIVINYNKALYLKKCLDSIINQTYKKFEIIVVDDGSTDNSKEVLDEYSNNEKIKIFYKKNTGVADTRNYAITKVKTKYFMFVDSDDYIEKDLLETCNKYKDYDILCFKAYKIYEEDTKKEKLEKSLFDSINGSKALEKFIKSRSFFLVPWGYIYNIDVLKKNKLKYKENYVMEDIGLTPIIILKSKKVISIDYYGYFYVQTKSSVVRTTDPKKIELNTKSTLYHCYTLIKYFNKNIKNNKLKKIYCGYFAEFLLWYGTKLEKNELKKYIIELKERKIAYIYKPTGLSGMIVKIICIIDYNLYYRLRKIVKFIKNKGRG